MIQKRTWIDRYHGGTKQAVCEGWCLLGIIPIYLKRTELQ